MIGRAEPSWQEIITWLLLLILDECINGENSIETCRLQGVKARYAHMIRDLLTTAINALEFSNLRQ